MRTLQCTVPAAFDGRPLKHLLRGELDLRLRVCQQPFGPVHTKTIYILGLSLIHI